MRNTFLVFCSASLVAAAALAGCGGNSLPDCGDLVACSTSASGSTTGAGGGTSSATTTTSGTGGMGGMGGAPTTTSTSGSTGTGSGVVCGGKQGKQCLPTEYCDFPADACSLADETGACTARPGPCPDLYAPTCACDGTVYSSPCEAAAAGVDINIKGTCTPPTGKFACGSMFCEVGISYCERDTSDVGSVPSTYGCKPLPPSCGLPATCACLANVVCGSMCAASVDGAGLVVTCPGG